MDRENRIFLWDNLKFILILLVVIGHFVSPYTGKSSFFKELFAFIYSFHMPLFIFIAGYFHKNENILKKIYFFIILRLILRLFIFTEFVILGSKPKFNLFVIPDITWFMFAMAAFIGFAYLLRNIDCKFVLLMSIVIGCIVGYDPTVNDYLASSRIFVYFPYYVAGILAHKNQYFVKPSTGATRKIVSLIIVVLWFLTCVFFLKYSGKLTPFFTGRHPYASSYYYWGGLIRLFTYFLVTAIGYSIIRLTPRYYIPLISDYGKRTLQVYFWHKIFLNILLHYNILSICTTFVGKTVYLFIAVAMTFLLSHKGMGFPVINIKQICLRE